MFTVIRNVYSDQMLKLLICISRLIESFLNVLPFIPGVLKKMDYFGDCPSQTKITFGKHISMLLFTTSCLEHQKTLSVGNLGLYGLTS